MGNGNGVSEMTHPRMKKQPLIFSIGYRLYELFCVDCSEPLMSECEHLQQLQCGKCSRMYAYRMHPQKEQACLEMMIGQPPIQ